MHELSQAPALQFKEWLIVFIVVTKNDVTDAGGQSIPAMRPVFFGNLACMARDEAWETRSFQHVSVIAHCRSTEMENTDAEHFETTTTTALFPVCVFNWVRHSFRFAQAPTKTARWVDAEGSAGAREQQVLYERINSEALCYF